MKRSPPYDRYLRKSIKKHIADCHFLGDIQDVWRRKMLDGDFWVEPARRIGWRYFCIWRCVGGVCPITSCPHCVKAIGMRWFLQFRHIQESAGSISWSCVIRSMDIFRRVSILAKNFFLWNNGRASTKIFPIQGIRPSLWKRKRLLDYRLIS